MFLRESSARIQLENTTSLLVTDLQNVARQVYPKSNTWDRRLNQLVVADMVAYRQYSYTSVRDLLRAVRNMYSHYIEKPANIKGILGRIPEEFDECITDAFPHLLFEVDKVMEKHCRNEDQFIKYFGP